MYTRIVAPSAFVSPVLVQQNSGGTTFIRGWSDYKSGFCAVNGDYWLGNDQLYQLSSTGQYKLRIELQAQNGGQWSWAEYSYFRVDMESNGYKLTVGGVYWNCWRCSCLSQWEHFFNGRSG